MLDTGVVDKDVYGAEARLGVSDHCANLLRLGHVRAGILDLYASLGSQVSTGLLDFCRIAESIQHDVDTSSCKRPSNSEPDTASGASYDCRFAFKHH